MAVMLLVALPAAAEDDAADARFFDRMARRAFAQRRHDAAVELFLQSQRAAPNPRTLFNVAVAAELAERWSTALSYYAEYVATAPTGAPERRARAERAVARLQQRVPTVWVTTVPPGATIYVDREELGAAGTSPRLVPVDAGERRIIAEHPGYHRVEARVTAAPGEAAEVSLELEPVVGRLRVDASPAGATIVVTRPGEEVARGGAPLERRLPVGEYRVRADVPGHGADSTTVTVSRDGVARVRLTARPRGGRAGRLLVSSGAVLGAEVRLDGRWVGRTPLTLPQARAGVRELEVRADGYRAWTGRVTVPSDGVVHLPVTLAPAGKE